MENLESINIDGLYGEIIELIENSKENVLQTIFERIKEFFYS